VLIEVSIEYRDLNKKRRLTTSWLFGNFE